MVSSGRCGIYVFIPVGLKDAQGGFMPRYARAARFDYDSKRVSCTQDTRTEILDTIYHWFDQETLDAGGALPTPGNPRGRVLWLDRVSGTVKVTNAHTVV